MEFLTEFNVMFAALLFIALIALLVFGLRYLCQDFSFVTKFIENELEPLIITNMFITIN